MCAIFYATLESRCAPPQRFGHASADRRWVGLLNLKKWIFLPVFSVGFVLVAWIYPSSAAQLRDIRVGEHETHTRIVFELSDSSSDERILPMPSGQLTVIFPNTGLDLIRKIPLDRSERLKALQIWNRQNELSLVITFAFKQFRYERSKFDHPTRLVLDVFQLSATDATFAPPATDAAAMPSQTGKDATAPDESTPALTPQKDVDTPESALPSSPKKVPSSRMDEPAATQAVQPASPETAKRERQQHTPAPPPLLEQSEAPTQVATARTESLPPERQSEPPGIPMPRPKRLQYYLVIGLIILTLVILVLLLVMLVSKNRWANASAPIQPDAFLERQEERIAEIDAKIHEQLKRFDNG